MVAYGRCLVMRDSKSSVWLRSCMGFHKDGCEKEQVVAQRDSS